MNKLLLCLAFQACLLAAADDPGQDKASVIPPGAVKVDEQTSKYTDAQGRVWVYRRTPFGIQKYEEKQSAALSGKTEETAEIRDTPFGKVKVPPPGAGPEAPARADDSLLQSTRVREQGDTLYFERPGPFGAFRWSRKKSDLTEEEKSIWERQKSSAGSRKAQE